MPAGNPSESRAPARWVTPYGCVSYATVMSKIQRSTVSLTRKRGPCAMCPTIRDTQAGARFGPDLTHFASRPTIGAGTAPNTPGAWGVAIAR